MAGFGSFPLGLVRPGRRMTNKIRALSTEHPKGLLLSETRLNAARITHVRACIGYAETVRLSVPIKNQLTQYLHMATDFSFLWWELAYQQQLLIMNLWYILWRISHTLSQKPVTVLFSEWLLNIDGAWHTFESALYCGKWATLEIIHGAQNFMHTP